MRKLTCLTKNENDGQSRKHDYGANRFSILMQGRKYNSNVHRDGFASYNFSGLLRPIPARGSAVQRRRTIFVAIKGLSAILRKSKCKMYISFKQNTGISGD